MFEEIYEYQNLYNSYLKARRQKRYRGEILQFSYSLEENLIELQNELLWKTYKVGDYRPFVIYEPKRREIVALPFRDRVVQHALNNVIESVFDKRMIFDSYACRQGKGTHKAVRRLSYFIGKPQNRYYLKADIKSYFASINRTILRESIIRRIQDQDVVWLIDTILNSSPGNGLPIGNLMSQLFANAYLHELDHYIKNNLGVRFYLRYMDDFLILHSSKTYLKDLLGDIKNFVWHRLALKLNNKTMVGKTSDGIEFVGYRVWKNNKLIKKQSISKMKRKLKAWKSGKIQTEKYLASLGSWIGHSKGTAGHRFVEKIMLESLYFFYNKSKNGGSG